MMKLTIKQKEAFADDFLKHYLSNGYGTMGKAEIDIMVFHLISEALGIKGKSNYELANELRITESKVKSLRLNSALRYNQPNHKAVLAEIVQRITAAMQKPEFSEGTVAITIENPVEQRELTHAIKLAGRHVNHTLNSEVFEIAPIALFELVVQNLENAEDEFKKVIQDGIQDSNTQKKIIKNTLTFRQKLNKVAEEVTDIPSMISLLSSAAGAL